MPITSGFNTTVAFVLSAPSQRCADARSLSRSFSEEVRTRLHTTCATRRGDGFALVLYDALAPPDASTLGAAGGGIGYAGLPFSAAIEFDTLGDPTLEEPAVAHVAVLSRGVRLSDAHDSRCGVMR